MPTLADYIFIRSKISEFKFIYINTVAAVIVVVAVVVDFIVAECRL